MPSPSDGVESTSSSSSAARRRRLSGPSAMGRNLAPRAGGSEVVDILVFSVAVRLRRDSGVDEESAGGSKTPASGSRGARRLGVVRNFTSRGRGGDESPSAVSTTTISAPFGDPGGSGISQSDGTFTGGGGGADGGSGTSGLSKCRLRSRDSGEFD